MRLFAAPSRAASDIVLILVDQYSLDFYKKQDVPWPWPRQMYAPLLGFLKAGGAKAVFFDLVMTEPSPLKEDDAMLAKAISESGNVILPVALSDEDKETAPEADAFLKRTASKAEVRPWPGKLLSATADLPVLMDQSRGGAGRNPTRTASTAGFRCFSSTRAFPSRASPWPWPRRRRARARPPASVSIPTAGC